MRVGLSILMLIFAVGAGHATVITDKGGAKWTIIDPPQRYVRQMPKMKLKARPADLHKLPDYGPGVEMYEMPQAELKDVCSFWAAKSEHLGCSFPQADPCQVYVNRDIPILFRLRIAEHEVAHCMGWPADHPVD